MKSSNVMSRLRCSSHKLKVEAGRLQKPTKTPFDQRKCIYCNNIEDEFHFLFECCLYTDIRKKYVKKYYWKNPNILKFIELLKTENKSIIKNVSMFIHKAFEIRNNLNYS